MKVIPTIQTIANVMPNCFQQVIAVQVLATTRDLARFFDVEVFGVFFVFIDPSSDDATCHLNEWPYRVLGRLIEKAARVLRGRPLLEIPRPRKYNAL